MSSVYKLILRFSQNIPQFIFNEGLQYSKWKWVLIILVFSFKVNVFDHLHDTQSGSNNCLILSCEPHWSYYKHDPTTKFIELFPNTREILRT